MTVKKHIILYEIADITTIELFKDLFCSRIVPCNTMEMLKTTVRNWPLSNLPARILVVGALVEDYHEWLRIKPCEN